MSAWFVLVPVAILGGFLAFVWHRLTIAPGWRSRWLRWSLAIALVALLAAALAGFDAWGGWFTPAQLRPVVWVGQVFLAACFYLFLGLVPVWLACVAIWLVRWRHGHGAHARRVLNRVASPVVALVSLSAVGYGVVEAANPAITTAEVRSAQLPAEFDGVRVALITDIHAGAVRSAAFTREVVGLVNAARPDLVVVAGDLVDGPEARYGPELAPLADLRAPLGVFATTGNHEMFDDTAEWLDRFEQVGLTVLRNESVPLTRGGASIMLAGADDATGEGEYAADYGAALERTEPRAFTVFAAHQPLQAFEIQGRGVDLQLSGHTHGGQQWPIRYLVTLQQPYVDGYRVVGDVPVFTSRGVGAWGPPVRVAASPEVPIITLTRG
ncbi:MAG: metallophosphoesterase [Dermatophilaceae bacterium]